MKITLLTGKTFDIRQALGIDLKIVQSSVSRKLVLRIDGKERIPILSIPKYCTRKKAIDFVHENMDWIVENLQKLPEQHLFTDGEEISLFGKKVKISHQPAARCGVMLENNTLIVSGNAEFLHRRVRDYIHKLAAEEFYIRSKKLAAELGCRLNGVCIKDAKTRWGSCSTLGNINYSWRIALAPDFVIDYLVAHEVSHLKHNNHSAAFWQCVASLDSDWKKGRNWLKENGKILYAYK
jgi:hypothetical protein